METKEKVKMNEEVAIRVQNLMSECEIMKARCTELLRWLQSIKE